jgi:hypothetical protein
MHHLAVIAAKIVGQGRVIIARVTVCDGSPVSNGAVSSETYLPDSDRPGTSRIREPSIQIAFRNSVVFWA